MENQTQGCMCVFNMASKQCCQPCVRDNNMCEHHMLQTLMLHTKDKKLSDAKSKKLSKKKKDKTGPKRPISAFIFFCNAHRQNIKNQNPEMKQTEITVKLGEMWKDVKTKDKHKYEELAATDKKRYEAEKAKLTDTQPSGGVEA